MLTTDQVAGALRTDEALAERSSSRVRTWRGAGCRRSSNRSTAKTSRPRDDGEDLAGAAEDCQGSTSLTGTLPWHPTTSKTSRPPLFERIDGVDLQAEDDGEDLAGDLVGAKLQTEDVARCPPTVEQTTDQVALDPRR